MRIIIVPLKQLFFEGDPQSLPAERFAQRMQALQAVLLQNVSKIACVSGNAPAPLGNILNTVKGNRTFEDPQEAYQLGIGHLRQAIQPGFQLHEIDFSHPDRFGDEAPGQIPWYVDTGVLGDSGTQARMAVTLMQKKSTTAAILLGRVSGKSQRGAFNQILGVMFDHMTRQSLAFPQRVQVANFNLEELSDALQRHPSDWQPNLIPVLG